METELKFAAPAARAAEAAAQVKELAGAESRQLVSVYYDTDKLALRRAGFALRVRRENGEFIQTLKDAGDGLSRGEWEARLEGPEPDPQVLRGTPAGRLLGKGVRLAPVFTVDVRRRSADLCEGESLVELSLDEGFARAKDDEAAFAELELELKSGPEAGLFALARRLAAGSDLTLSFTTKAERGFALAKPPRTFAHKFEAPPLQAELTVAQAFQRIALACLRQISANGERLRHRASPEVIHQLRVGIRRLRSLLSSFKDVATDGRLPAIKAELKWLAGELDTARNLDVLLRGGYRVMVAGKEDADGVKGLGSRLRAARRMAYVRAAAAVEGVRFRQLLVDLLTWIEAGPWTSAPGAADLRERPIKRFALKELNRRRGKITKRVRGFSELDFAARHKLRIHAKKLRYAADVFVGLYGKSKRAKAFISALKDVQDSLGELNDVVVGERLTHEAALGPAAAEPDSVFVAGRLTGAQKARLGALTNAAEKALETFKDAKPFWK